MFPTDRRRANRWPNYYFPLITCSCLAWRVRTWKQRSILSRSPTNLNVTGSSHLRNKGAALELVAGQIVDLFYGLGWWIRRDGLHFPGTTWIWLKRCLCITNLVEPFKSRLGVRSRNVCTHTQPQAMCTFSIVQNSRGSWPFPASSWKTPSWLAHKYAARPPTDTP